MGRGWFEGQVGLVTGAGSGIGAAVVRRLVDEGCRAVVAVDLDEEAARTTAAASGAIEPAVADIADAASVDRVFNDAVERHGALDVVVHAAGVDDPESKAELWAARQEGRPPLVLGTATDAAWRRIMSVNLDGTFHVIRASARAMVPRRSGAIVTVGSSSAFDTFAGYGAYAASKAGVHALSQSAAKELAHFGIRVNTVAPGPVDTGMAARTPQVLRDELSTSGARGYATAEELSDTIAYLASPGAANVIGAVVLSNGGRFTV
jgi:3-oxoacyl-[acyl-carrier protein] reductase